MPFSMAGFSQPAQVPSHVYGWAETKSSRVDAIGSAKKRATHSTQPYEGSWHEPFNRPRQIPGRRQTDAVQADPTRHRAPHPDRRMAAGSSYPVRAPTDDALWLLANDGEQGAVGAGTGRSHRAATAGWHIRASSQIPLGSPDNSRYPRGDHRARPQLWLSVD